MFAKLICLQGRTFKMTRWAVFDMCPRITQNCGIKDVKKSWVLKPGTQSFKQQKHRIINQAGKLVARKIRGLSVCRPKQLSQFPNK